MVERFDYLSKFSVIQLGNVWEKEFEPIMGATPAIGEHLNAEMASWVEEMREKNPNFAIGLDLPIKFDPSRNPLKLQFYASGYGPRFESNELVGPEQISYWRSYRIRFLFSGLWLNLCKAWMPEGSWLRLDTEFHSILLELNSRTIFDPRFQSSRSAEYILNFLIIGEPVKNADYQQTCNITAWLNYHLKWHSRYNLPKVLENALQHDLPEYLAIMQSFSNVEMPSLKSAPQSEAQLKFLIAMPAPANARMI